MEINLKSKKNISLFLLYSSYTAGIIGLNIPLLQPVFIFLVPFHLLMSAGLLLLHQPHIDRFTRIYIIICMIAGYVAEYIGVHTGRLFGNYEYGSVLGLRVFEIPVLIGVNWMMLVFAFRSAFAAVFRWPVAVALAATAGMVALDYLIEPVAVHLGFWTWYGQPVPLFNYVCWAAVALFLFLIPAVLKKPAYRNPLAGHLLICQFSFFLILNIIFKTF